MRKRIGIYGATEEALALIPLLEANPGIEIAAVVDPAALALLERLPHLDPGLAGVLEQTLGSDLRALTDDPRLHAVIDTGLAPPFSELCAEGVDRGLQVVSPLTARLLWGHGVPGPGHQSELLQALREVVESYNLTVDTDELFLRMLEIAMGVTGADGGSLMLLDEDRGELRVQVAVGVEPELWPKIRVALGEGIAGRVAAEGRSLRLRGRADRERFRILRERSDVESALCVPLIHDGRILGVLNLHHGSRADAFSPDDLRFTEELAGLDAQIIARAQEHASLRSQAARYAAVREVQHRMAGTAPLAERLHAVCEFVAERTAGGIATLYRREASGEGLLAAATSLRGGVGTGARIGPGQGIDGQVAASRSPIFLRGPGGRIAYASLPLLAGGDLVGVLSVQSGPEAPVGRGAEETLQEIAAGVAEAIAAAERSSEIAARADLAHAINEAGIKLISSTDLAEVMRLGTSSAAMVLEAEHAVLRLQDETTRRYAIRSYFGSADGPLQEAIFRVDKEVSVDVLRRRAPLRISDLRGDARFGVFAAELRSCLAAPLLREGRIVGTLALYDHVPAEASAPVPFGETEAEHFASFVSTLERALANALFHDRAQRFRNFDEETGLPNERYLAQRIREEVARTAHRQGGVAVAVARLENLAEVEQTSDPVKLSRVVQRLVDSLRSHARDFDVVGRLEPDRFAVLMPEPGQDPGRRVLDLARAVAEDVSKDEALNTPVRVALGFGYAVHPADGRDPESLLARATEPRIHMV